MDVYKKLVGELVEKDISNNEFVKYGKEAEEHIRALFTLAHKEYQVIKPKTIEEDGYIEMLVRKDKPYMTATLDGELINLETQEQGILEIKTASISSHDKREMWENRVPQNYYCQLLHYFAVKEDATFAILVAELTFHGRDNSDYVLRKYYYFDRKDIQEDIDYLEQEETKFYEDYVSKKQEPVLVYKF